MRRIFTAALALSISILMSAIGVGSATAHAIVTRTDPPDNAILNNPPKKVDVWFSEKVTLNLTRVTMVDDRGNQIPVTLSQLSSHDVSAPEGSFGIEISLPKLAPGTYKISWRTISSDDLHPTAGSLVFGVQIAPAQNKNGASVPVLPDLGQALLQWLSLAWMALLAGSVFVTLIVFQGVAKEAGASALLSIVLRRLMKLTLFSGLLALLAGIGLLIAQSRELLALGEAAGTILGKVLFHTSFGIYWFESELLLILLSTLAAWQFRNVAREGGGTFSRSYLPAMTVAVIGLALVKAQSSHVTLQSGFSLLRMVIDAVHLMGASVWSGGLLALALVVVPLIRQGSAERWLARSILLKFGLFALASVVVLGLTGIFMAGQLVTSLDALLLTPYGRFLMLKILLVLVAGLAGLFNSASLHQGLARVLRLVFRRSQEWYPLSFNRLAQSISMEAGAVVVVLMLAALLVSIPPARGPEFDAPVADGSVPSEVVTQTPDLLVSLIVKPNRPGMNFVTVNVFNTRRPAPAPIGDVNVRFIAPAQSQPDTELTAVSQGSGHYQVTTDLFTSPGKWKIGLTIHRLGMSDTVLEDEWTVLPPVGPAYTRPVMVSNRPLAPILTATAEAGALVVFLVSLAYLARRRLYHQRRPGASQPDKQ
jgi:copper transport protein